MTTQVATPGRHVLVLVHPDDNNGADHAPAIVTRVVDDRHVSRKGFLAGRDDEQTPKREKRETEPHQLVDATVFLPAGPKHLAGVPLYADRATAHADQVEHRRALVGVRHPDGPDGKWTDEDIYRWTAAAYWPGAPGAASVGTEPES